MSERIIDCPAKVMVIGADCAHAAGTIAHAKTKKIASEIVFGINRPDFHALLRIRFALTLLSERLSSKAPFKLRPNASPLGIPYRAIYPGDRENFEKSSVARI
jgi:hypothetical protein